MAPQDGKQAGVTHTVAEIEIDRETDALVGEWLTLAETAESLGLDLKRVKQLLRDHKLLGVQRDGGLSVPAAFIQDGQPLKGLQGTLTRARGRRIRPRRGAEVAVHRRRLAAGYAGAGPGRAPGQGDQPARAGARLLRYGGSARPAERCRCHACAFLLTGRSPCGPGSTGRGSTCAPTRVRPRATWRSFLDAALAGGVDIVQLRQKGLEARQELEHLAVFRAACDRHGALLAVNDRADIAHADPRRRAAPGPGRPAGPARRAPSSARTCSSAGRRTPRSRRRPRRSSRGSTTSVRGRPGRRRPSPAVPRRAFRCWSTPPDAGSPGRGSRSAASTPANLDEVLAAGRAPVVVVRAITEARRPARGGRGAGAPAAPRVIFTCGFTRRTTGRMRDNGAHDRQS